MLKFTLIVLLGLGLTQALPTVNDVLHRTLRYKGTADLVITLTHGATADVLKSVQQKHFNSRSERLNGVAGTLKASADLHQAELLNFLAREKSPLTSVRPFWINNKIFVRGADVQLYKKLLNREDILEIRTEKIVPLDMPKMKPVSLLADPQPNVAKISAPQVWNLGFTGEGAVVANIDTGVRVTHEALAGNHRAEYGWFDPYDGTDTPADSVGHGTHTMGIMAGQENGIGVAPGAQWVACKGCSTASCTELALVACGQWALCPTDTKGQKAECAAAPHVVSNSWGGGQGDNFYDEVLIALSAGGVFTTFASGGSGPICSSIASPSDSKETFAVGSVDTADTVTGNSGTGPTLDGRVKPDIAAPGTEIISAFSTDDTSYVAMSGTSMSSPHVAGVIALLLSKNPTLTLDELRIVLTVGAVPTPPSGGPECGGIPDTDYPNNKVGAGRVDALYSIYVTPDN